MALIKFNLTETIRDLQSTCQHRSWLWITEDIIKKEGRVPMQCRDSKAEILSKFSSIAG
ncbi:hypothetical protein T4C_8172 [Trichinella pseudospiralis]|uniref:Uncharacterized protein n=1 Tax=Trichinella pseudospiralis TaxID=6337 RepID=A0A0V1JU85_TRIPS|nr:hypothetical protein T4C_8172 [Trichinella pseudospiralis]